MDQERLDEIRAQIEGWNEGFTDDEILCEANGIILCVPALLDEVERLRAALRLAESRCHDIPSLSVGLDGKVRGVHQCKVCFAKFRSWVPGDKHTDDCVFVMLED